MVVLWWYCGGVASCLVSVGCFVAAADTVGRRERIMYDNDVTWDLREYVSGGLNWL